MVRRFKSKNRETQIPRYLAVLIRIEILIGFGFLCISRYKFRLRFWFWSWLKPPHHIRISIFISLTISSRVSCSRERCERCLLITESPKTPSHYRYLIWVLVTGCIGFSKWNGYDYYHYYHCFVLFCFVLFRFCLNFFCFPLFGPFLTFPFLEFIKCVCGLIWMCCGGNVAWYVPCTFFPSLLRGHVGLGDASLFVYFLFF